MTALPTHCHRCPFGERHMRETVCTLDGRCVSLPDLSPEWCPLRNVATLRRERDEARSVIAGVVAALGERCTGDLPADVARLREHLATVCRVMPQVSPDDPQSWDRAFKEALGVVVQQAVDAERSDLRDSLDRLRALADECQLECRRPVHAADTLAGALCGRCPECLLRAALDKETT